MVRTSFRESPFSNRKSLWRWCFLWEARRALYSTREKGSSRLYGPPDRSSRGEREPDNSLLDVGLPPTNVSAKQCQNTAIWLPLISRCILGIRVSLCYALFKFVCYETRDCVVPCKGVSRCKITFSCVALHFFIFLALYAITNYWHGELFDFI